MKTAEILEKSTPRPWRDGRGYASLAGDDRFGAQNVVNCAGWSDTRRDDVNEVQHANAELVKLAVNAYEPMLAALRNIQSYLLQENDGAQQHAGILVEIQNAIAAAGEEK